VASLETTTKKKHTERPVFLYVFFRKILEAATILSASFNLSRDSLSGRWCVRRSEFRNARYRPPCANARPEKKKGAITRLHEVRTLEKLFTQIFLLPFWKVHSCMLGATVISTNFLRNYLLARPGYFWWLSWFGNNYCKVSANNFATACQACLLCNHRSTRDRR